MDVFAKLFKDRLVWCLEAEAFSRGEIGGEDDVLDFLVGHLVNIDLTWQPAPQSTIGVFDSALLPGGVSIAEPGGHGAHAPQQGMPGEGRVIIESDGLAQRGFDAGEDRQHDRDGLGGGLSGEPRGECHAGFALMENEHGPHALADDEVALPMTGFGSGVDILGPFVDGDAILDRISRRPRSAGTTAFVAAREITPQLLGFLGGAIDESVDRLAANASQTAFIFSFQPARDLLGRPAFREAVANESL